eukprot:TRINITY_DN15449_c0_g1_i1.p1 TRINITY_DN15449_c0_g1~~TRINITY_DN15449_c0_g1_i1.p1  ORF type:complete len:155 (-),score=20.76 TRINITY_DN15449_c0_g1_i1:86-550(-)
MVNIDQARYNVLRIGGLGAVVLGIILLISAAAVPTHEEHYCYLRNCTCHNATQSPCRNFKVQYWIDEQESFHYNYHTSDLPICPRQAEGDGFLCWTDSDGNDLHIASPAERSMTNLATASFTFTISGVFLLFPALVVKLLVVEGDETAKLPLNV